MRSPFDSGIPVIGSFSQDVDDESNPVKQWEEESRMDRLRATGPAKWFLIVASVFFIGSVILYLYPALPSLHKNNQMLIVTGNVVLLLVAYLKGRADTIEKLKNIHMRVVYLGNSVEIAYGRDAGEYWLTLKDIGYGLLTKEWATLKDIFSRTEVEQHTSKHHRFSEQGDERIRDDIHKTSEETEVAEFDTQLLGKVIVQHASEIYRDERARDIDRSTGIPRTIDARDVTKYRNLMEDTQFYNQELRRRERAAKDALNELEDMVDSTGRERLEDVLMYVETVADLSDKDNADDDEESGRSLDINLNKGDKQ